MNPNLEIDTRELRSETLPTQLVFLFNLFDYLAPVPSGNFFHHPQKVLSDAAVLDFISHQPKESQRTPSGLQVTVPWHCDKTPAIKKHFGIWA